MVVLAFFVAQWSNSSWQISAINDAQIRALETHAKVLNRSLRNGGQLKQILRRMGRNGRWQMMAVNTQTQDVITGFPPSVLRQREKFSELIDFEGPFSLKTHNLEFIGPVEFRYKNQTYNLYAGRLLRLEERPGFGFSLALLVFLISGTLACVAIAYTITKPLKQLSIASKKLAEQNMSTEQAFAFSSSRDNEQYFGQSTRKDELGQLHRDVVAMADKLGKSAALQKALLANISHELRTPLTRLQLALAMLEPTSEQQHYADRIEKEVGVMDALISQALQLARLNDQSNVANSKLETYALADLTSELFADLAFEAEASKVAFSHTDIPKVEVVVDRNSFLSAIENVTRNAIKYGKDKVEIGVAVTTKDLKKGLEVTIDDNGDGVDQAQLESIFEAFNRGSITSGTSGSGLGLAIAKAAVLSHGGNISASTSPIGGLRICLWFPVCA